MTPEVSERPSERRRSRQREETRRGILDATESLLVEAGYEAFSMRRLADRCGYTAPTIYHYFGDKRGLIDALIEERFALMVERIRRVSSEGDALATLRAQLAAFVDFGLENPTHYQLLTAPRLDDAAPPPQSAEEGRSLIELTLARLAREGRLHAQGIEEAVQCIWVMLHGLISLRISRPSYEWTPSQVDASLDILLRGLVSPGAAASEPARQNP